MSNVAGFHMFAVFECVGVKDLCRPCGTPEFPKTQVSRHSRAGLQVVASLRDLYVNPSGCPTHSIGWNEWDSRSVNFHGEGSTSTSPSDGSAPFSCVSGHGFSRAECVLLKSRALAPERAQGLKPPSQETPERPG